MCVKVYITYIVYEYNVYMYVVYIGDGLAQHNCRWILYRIKEGRVGDIISVQEGKEEEKKGRDGGVQEKWQQHATRLHYKHECLFN